MEEQIRNSLEDKKLDLEKEKAKLVKEKEKINQEIKNWRNKTNYNDSRFEKPSELKEYETDIEKVDKEISKINILQNDLENEIINIGDWFTQKEKVLLENKEVQGKIASLEKTARECKEAIAELEGKNTFENGKLVRPREALEYEKDLDKINGEIARNKKITEHNNQMIEEYDENINMIVEKYSIVLKKSEPEVEPKIEFDDEKDQMKPQEQEENLNGNEQQVEKIEEEQEEVESKDESKKKAETVKLNFDEDELSGLIDKCEIDLKSLGVPEYWADTGEGNKIANKLNKEIKSLWHGLDNEETLTEEEIIKLNKAYDKLYDLVLSSFSKETIDKINQQLEEIEKEQEAKGKAEKKESNSIKLKFALPILDFKKRMYLQDMDLVLPKNWDKTEEGQKIKNELLKEIKSLEKALVNEETLSKEEIIKFNKIFDELPLFIKISDISKESMDKMRQQLKEIDKEQKEQKQEPKQEPEPVKLNFDEEKLEKIEEECTEHLKHMGLPEGWFKTEEGRKIGEALQKKFDYLEKGLKRENNLSEEEITKLNKTYEELNIFKTFNSFSKETMDKIKQQLEQMKNGQDSEKYKKGILDDPEADQNRDKKLPIDMEVNLGRKGYVIYDRKKYKISKGALKGIPYLTESSIKDLIEESGIEIKEPELLKEALMGKNIDYAVVKGILSANKMSNEIKVNILNTYLNECLQMEDCIKESKFEEAYRENKCNIIYNLKDLSKAGGMYEGEKNKFLMRVGKAQRFNIGETEGKYKPSLIARAMAKLNGTKLKMLGQYEEEVGRRADQIAYKEQTTPNNKDFVKALREQAYMEDVDFGTYKDENGDTRDAGKTRLNYDQMDDVKDVVEQMSQDFGGRE